MAPAGPPPRGAVGELLDRLLAYMDRPWKAAAVIVLVIVCGAGYGLWLERETVVLWLRPAGRPAVLKTDVSGPLDDVLNHTSADAAMVWSIDLARNTAFYSDGRQRGGGSPPFAGDRLPAVGHASNPQALAQLLSGQPWCDGLPAAGTPFGDRLAAAGYHTLCIVPVPPEPSALVIGILVLAWKAPPNAAYRNAAVAVAQADAARMVLR